MLAANLTELLARTLTRPDLRVVAAGLAPTLDETLTAPFRITPRDRGATLAIGPSALDHPGCTPTVLRHAIELAHLVRAGVEPVLASIAAARVAALFHALDRPDTPHAPAWLRLFARDFPPDAGQLQASWHILASRLSDPPALSHEQAEHLRTRLLPLWNLLAPAENLMSGGGDSRLAIDPRTGLNRYACSHRPRPWALAYGSSTASSLSERGFDGAERARRDLISTLLTTHDAAAAQEAVIRAARRGIARHYGLDDDSAILAASGTDCELAVLAIASGMSGKPVTNILVAPDETGSGVPLAACGRNFASDSACATAVSKGELIAGFPADTRLTGVPIRTPDGTARSLHDIDADCAAHARAEAARGRFVLLHRLDQSKTGIAAPSMEMVETLRDELGDMLGIVIDACQARLQAPRIGGWVRSGMMVMITGSKFFTGPPFCGALLLPPSCCRDLARTRLPEGLRDYSNRSEWPATADSTALNTGYNIGLALRWHAAITEMDALFALPDATIHRRLEIFMKQAASLIENAPALTPLPVARLPGDGTWDAIPTILSFLVTDPRQDGAPLGLEDARSLHRWLNADLSRLIADENAAVMCVLGQPVPVAHHRISTGFAGALRLCAGARLVSEAPDQDPATEAAYLSREVEGAARVLRKLDLVLRHWDILLAADPVPHYAPFP